MLRQTLTSDNIDISYIGKQAQSQFMFDKRRLQQVLLNVLSNAIKFQDYGEIRVFSSIQQQEDDVSILEIIVKDQGIGMTRQQVENAFEPLCQSSERVSANYETNGLGLMICKKICEQLGGTISIQSTRGSGTSVKFSMKVFRQRNSQIIKKRAKKFSKGIQKKELETINEQSEIDISISFDERPDRRNGSDEQDEQEEEEAVAFQAQ